MTVERYRKSQEDAAELLRRVRPAGARGVDDALHDLRDRAGSEFAVESRTARNWERRAGEDSATWLGTLLDLAEAGDTVAVGTDRGSTLLGVIEAVGRDFLVLRSTSHEQVICASDTVTSVRAAHRRDTAQGERETADVDLQMLLHMYAGERRSVVVQPRGVASTPIAGTLLSCGTDVCSLRSHPTSAAGVERLPTVIVRIGAIASVTVSER